MRIYKLSSIPGNPEAVYKGKGWKGWDDFLSSDANTKAESRHEAKLRRLDCLHAGLASMTDEQFEAHEEKRMEELRAFVIENSRNPRKTKKDRAERELAEWVYLARVRPLFVARRAAEGDV